MQAAYYNKTKKDVNIKEMMDSWINQNYYPILNVKRNKDHLEISTVSTIHAIWWIPLSYTVQMHIDFKNTLFDKWLNSQNSLFLTFFTGLYLNLNDDWIIFNLQQTGVYIYALYLFFYLFYIYIYIYIHNIFIL